MHTARENIQKAALFVQNYLFYGASLIAFWKSKTNKIRRQKQQEKKTDSLEKKVARLAQCPSFAKFIQFTCCKESYLRTGVPLFECRRVDGKHFLENRSDK